MPGKWFTGTTAVILAILGTMLVANANYVVDQVLGFLIVVAALYGVE